MIKAQRLQLTFFVLDYLPKKNTGLIVRQASWDVLQAVAAGAFADIALERSIRRHSLNNSDIALATEISYGAIRQRYFLDCWIDFFGKIPAVKQPPLLRWLLHIGLYQVLKMQNIPVSAAVNTTVELSKTKGLKKLAPVVNGIMRSAIRLKERGESLPTPVSPILRIAQDESLPVWLIKALIDWRDENDTEKIAKVFNKVPKLDLRVNSLRDSRDSLKRKFDQFGIRSKYIEDCPQGLEVLSADGDLTKWPGYLEGCWSVQDRSSQAVAPLLAAKSGERVLDACSAPGGKSTHIAELMNNEGEVWAVDRSKKRLNRLLLNSNRLGTSCIKTLVADSSKLLDLKPKWKGYFHKILLDAPCSGLGTLARHTDARWRMNPEKIKELVLLQSQLLKGVVSLLKPGGKLIYSTCTLHPDENCNQVHRFTHEFKSFNLQYENQAWPLNNDSGDGFYMAVLNN